MTNSLDNSVLFGQTEAQEDIWKTESDAVVRKLSSGSAEMNASLSVSMGISTQVPNASAGILESISPWNSSAVTAYKLMELPPQATTVR